MEIANTCCLRFNHQMAKSKIFLPAFLALFLWGFLFAGSAKAQEADLTAPPLDASDDTALTGQGSPPEEGESVDTDGDGIADILEVEERSTEVMQDFDITIEDMEANRATIMPDSPFHPFKRFGHAFTEAITFDPVAKAELRMEHANDMLAETMQMIEEDGMRDVDHEAVASAIERYEGKVEQITGQIKDVKTEKETQPEAVEVFLDDFVDKQLTQQKVLDNITEDVLVVKEDDAAAGEEINIAIEQIVATVEDVKGQVMTSFTDVLSGVEDTPEDMATRLSDRMDEQVGSDFKHLKNLEILESVIERVPETAQEAITQAKENTKKKFEVKISSLPPAVRAEKFEQYVEHATVDETRLMTLLDELKQSTGIPADILAKLEEAKEIAVRKFEQKLEFIDDVAVEQRYFDRFDTTGVDGLIAMEEFKNRMSQESEMGQRMAQAHDESVDAFKNMFSDVDSQFQAERFQALTEEMMNNPNPKTFKLLQQLEEQVMSDPTKRAFLMQTEAAMKNQFETRFRREGDMFMDRITSLDPYDIGIMEEFDFGDDFRGRFVEKNTEHFQDYMQGMDQPEHFDMFRDRFSQAPEFVINEIKMRDTGFQDAMMFKMRKMEETRSEREREIVRASLDFEEREVNFQMDRMQRQKEDEFWDKLNSISHDDFDSRKQLWDEKINDQYSMVEERFNEQKRMFEERLMFDPFCDETCKQIQIQFMDQELRHEKERMGDDLVRERNRIEREKQQMQQNDPLFGKCDSEDSCDRYCENNPSVRGCEWMQHDFGGQACPAPGWWDFAINGCQFPENMPPDPWGGPDPWTQPGPDPWGPGGGCPMGEIWMYDHCEFDPYYKPPENFIDCPFGHHWNDWQGFCEPDFQQCNFFAQVRDCNPGEKPIPPDPNDMCGQPSCIPKMQYCPDISAMMPAQCPEGQYREMTTDNNGCPGFGGCIDDGQGGPPDSQCPTVYEPVCGMNGKTYDNECQAKSYGIGIQYYGGCEGGGFQNCGWGEFYEPMINRCIKETDYVPWRPGECDYGWKWTGELCERDSGVSGGCAPMCETACYNGTFCVYDNMGCATGCSPECKQGEFYDQWAGGCIPSHMPPPPSGGWCGDGMCDPMEKDKGNCAEDCGGGAGAVCGNGICEGNEYCPMDCEGTPMTCNNNGYCDNGETMMSCPSDCGSMPTTCPSVRFNDWSNTFACDYGECPQGCVFDMQGCPSGCTGEGGGYCGDNFCGSGETMSSCAADCGGSASTCTDSDSGIDYNAYGYTEGEREGDRVYGTYYDSCGDSVGDSGKTSGSYIAETHCSGTTDPYVHTQWYACPNGCQNGACTSDTTAGCNTHTIIDPCQSAGCVWCAETSGCYNQGHVCYDSSITCPVSTYTTDAGACNYDVCSSGCEFEQNNGCPIGCYDASTSGWCGDGTCNNTESGTSCPEDCQVYVSCTPVQANSFTNSSDCNYSACANGCNYDNSGCPTGCMTSGGVCAVNVYNTYSGSMNCNWSHCENGCTYNSTGCPTACASAAAVCGDGTCDSSETQSICPADCGGYCGDGSCSATESSSTCPADCGSATTGQACGSTTCAVGDYCANSTQAWCCADGTVVCDDGRCMSSYSACTDDDIMECTSFSAGIGESCDPSQGICCSDGSMCDSMSGPGTCEVHDDNDYGSGCPSNSYTDTSGACDYSYCSNGCNFDSSGCPYECMNTDVCGDGNCTGSETSSSCSSDCGVASYCGDGTCDSSEDSYSCESDCGVPYVDDGYMSCDNWVGVGSSCDPSAGTCCSDGMCSNMSGPGTCEAMSGGWCGDGMCDGTESSDWCPEDCGGVMGASTKRDIVQKYNPFNLLKPIASFLGGNN